MLVAPPLLRHNQAMPTADEFRLELSALLAGAQRNSAQYVDINAGDLHRRLGGYPGSSHQMPTCCSVMDAERRTGDIVLSSPPSGKGASLTVRYRLPR